MTTRDARGRFPPGVSGNPAGRGQGARNKLGHAFVAALEEDFTEHGKDVIAAVRENKPHEYLKVVASLLPREMHFKDTTLDDMTDDDIRDCLAAIRAFRAERDGTATDASSAGEDDPAASRH